MLHVIHGCRGNLRLGVERTMRAKKARMPGSLPPLSVRHAIASPVTDHKFTVGQAVRLSLPHFGLAQPPETYRIVKLLPKEANDHQYRIKSDTESYERVVRESQLQAVP